MPSVLVIDDHPAICNAVRLALRREWTVVAAGNGAEGRVLARSAEDSPLAAIVDLGLPGEDGFAIAAELTEMGLKVVVFSASDDRASVALAVAAGAVAFLGKSRHETELVFALRAVLIGERYFPGDYKAAAGLSPLLETLTPTERRVFLLIGEGHQTKAIAEKLDRSPRTIEGHRHAIAAKLNVGAGDLVQFAVSLRNSSRTN